jgi:hypothetical protein
MDDRRRKKMNSEYSRGTAQESNAAEEEDEDN